MNNITYATCNKRGPAPFETGRGKQRFVRSRARSFESGFALLYSVIVITLILTIAISISNISYKQGILSSLAKDSQIAFYQADAGAECALYWDAAGNLFPLGSSVSTVPDTLQCGDALMHLVPDQSADDYFLYEESSPAATEPCFTFVIDKVTDPAVSTVEARGHNVCAAGPRQVERAVQVRY
jgi:hypothetical protein